VVVVIAVCAALMAAATGSGSSAPVVPCAVMIGRTSSPYQGGYRLVLGRMSAPPAYLAGGAVHVAAYLGFGPLRYWQKAGMVVRKGDFTVTVSVPKAWRARAAITWGGAGGSVLRFSGCPREPLTGVWNAYAGGFYLRDQAACVPLVFSDGHKSATVRFGIGRRCR
jgi:hypothetical protein